MQVERGIDDKRWGPTPAAGGDELQERALREKDAVAAELASVGIDTEELMLLLCTPAAPLISTATVTCRAWSASLALTASRTTSARSASNPPGKAFA